MIHRQGTIFSLILSPDMHRDFRGFCLLSITFFFATIGKEIRSNTMPCRQEIIQKRIPFCHVFPL
jgi:hypothetical protein